MIHGTLNPSSTTSSGVVLFPDSYNTTPSISTGDRVTFVVRHRPPRTVIFGPIFVENDGINIQVHGTPGLECSSSFCSHKIH